MAKIYVTCWTSTTCRALHCSVFSLYNVHNLSSPIYNNIINITSSWY